MKTNTIVAILLSVGFILSVVVPAWATSHVNYFPDSSIDVSPPWQYINTDIAISQYDDSIDFRAANKWPAVSSTPDYKINPTRAIKNSDVSSDAEFISLINAAVAHWNNTMAGVTDYLPVFEYVGTTPDDPSAFGPQCPDSSNSIIYDGENEIGFCPYSRPGAVMSNPSYRTTAGASANFAEMDMILNSLYPDWKDVPNGQGTMGDRDVQATATHEFGHWYGLGDVYDLYPGAIPICFAFSNEQENPKPVMCDGLETITVPDKNGIRQFYADNVSEDLTQTTGYTVGGADVALARINTTSSSNGAYDMIAVFGEYSGTTSNLRAEFVWDLNADSGDGTSGTVVTLQSGITGIIREVGASFEKIDNDAFADLIVTYIVENPTGTYKTYIRIWKDITRSTTSSSSAFSATGGSTAATEIVPAANSFGTDVFAWDINNNNQKDVVVMTTKASGAGEALHYFYAQLNSDFTIGAWAPGADSGDWVIGERAIGATLYDKSKRLVAVSYWWGSWYDVELFHMTTGTAIDYNQEKMGPLRAASLTEEGAGAGEAVNIGGVAGQNFPDMVWMYLDSDDAEWFVEWDSRLNSHP